MELVSKELQDRLNAVEAQIKSMQGELLLSGKEALSYAERFKLLEATDQRHEDELRALKDGARGMQRQFEQVMGKIDALENKLFTWMQQLNKDSSKERQSTQKEWMRFLQIVLGGTIFIIVAYVFSTAYRN
ncbi:hypothetical protein [Cohnella nanjingensis]|nr:hypothetical protein [Cohnella nanjingensis]